MFSLHFEIKLFMVGQFICNAFSINLSIVENIKAGGFIHHILNLYDIFFVLFFINDLIHSDSIFIFDC